MFAFFNYVQTARDHSFNLVHVVYVVWVQVWDTDLWEAQGKTDQTWTWSEFCSTRHYTPGENSSDIVKAD